MLTFVVFGSSTIPLKILFQPQSTPLKKTCQSDFGGCVSKVIMSPLTAKLKCPHGTRENTHGAEGVTEVTGDGAGDGEKDQPERSRGEDGSLLPASQTDQTGDPVQRGQGTGPWESGKTFKSAD